MSYLEADIERRRRAQQEAVSRIRPASPFLANLNLSNQTDADKPPSPRISVASQPATGISGTLNLPRPTEPSEIRPTGDAAVRMPEVAMPPSPSTGPSIRGMGKLDRDIAMREALSSADPESRVRIAGDQIDVSPPAMQGVGRRGRFSTGGEAVLNALGSGDPDRPLYSLGQALGAGLTGIISPRAGAKINRRFDMSRLDNDIARGVKLEQEQAQLGSLEAQRRQRELEPTLQIEKMERERDIENAKLEIERQKAVGVVTQRQYEQERDRLNRESRERIASDNRASQERIAGMRPDGSEARQAKAVAAQAEYDSLLVEEEAAQKEKDRAYKVLDDARKNPSLAKEDIAQIEDAAKQADREYRSFADKKREAQRRVNENKVTTAQPYAGRTMSQANLERYAKDHGLSVEQARAEIEAQGVKIQ